MRSRPAVGRAVILALSLAATGCERLAHTREDGTGSTGGLTSTGRGAAASSTGSSGRSASGSSGSSGSSTSSGSSASSGTSGTSSTSASSGSGSSSGGSSASSTGGSSGSTGTVPAAPTGLTVAIDTSSTAASWTATLSWQPPANTGGPPIVGYTVEATGTSASGPQPTVRRTVAATTVSGFGPLVVDAHYRFTVSAINAVGTGPSSSPVSLDACATLTPVTFADAGAVLSSGTLGKLALVDLNGDTVADLVYSEGTSIWFALAASGGFDPPRRIFGGPTTAAISGFAVGDVNADLVPDVVFAVNGAFPVLRLALATGAGSFNGAYQVSLPSSGRLAPQYRYVVIREVPGGDPAVDIGDVANGVLVDVEQPLGSATVTSAGVAGARLSGLAVLPRAAPELVTVDGSSGATWRFENGALVTSASVPLSGFSRGVFTADLDGDGVPDLVVGPEQGAALSLSVHMGLADGGFSAPTPYPLIGYSSANYGLSLADVNADGILDILHANSTDGSIGVLVGRGDGSFGQETRALTGLSNPGFIAAGDFTGDGQPDLAVAAGTQVQLFANTTACH